MQPVASVCLLIFNVLVVRAVVPPAIANAEAKALIGAKSLFQIAVDNVFADCFRIPSALCIGGTTEIITGRKTPENLVGWWPFDDIYAVDKSGFGNHMHPAVRAGPSLSGHGSSGAFLDGTTGMIKASQSLQVTDFVLAFWIYLVEESSGVFRKIISKGSESTFTPTVLLYPNIRKLSVRVSSNLQASEGMPSVGSIPLRRWTHVAVRGTGTQLALFINGIKDTEAALRGSILSNKEDITIGSFGGYLDDLRLYRGSLSSGDIASLSSMSITGVAVLDAYSLGCVQCSRTEATLGQTCSNGSRLCSLADLYSGGFHTARINGWLTATRDVWYADMPETLDSEEFRMAICCLEEIAAPVTSA